MPRIHLQRSHTLGLDGARRVAGQVAADLERSHGVRSRWEGAVLVFGRPGLKGRLTVGETTIDLDVTLGLVLAPLRASLEAAMSERLDRVLESGA